MWMLAPLAKMWSKIYWNLDKKRRGSHAVGICHVKVVSLPVASSLLGGGRRREGKRKARSSVFSALKGQADISSECLVHLWPMARASCFKLKL